MTRAARLLVGVACGALGFCLTLRAHLGMGPWHVVQEGLAGRLGVTVGTAVVIVNLCLLVAALSVGDRPGLGTLASTLLSGPAVDLMLPHIPTPEAALARTAMLLAGLAVMSFGGALYLSALLGAHPLDGLMNALYRRGLALPLYGVRLGMEAVGLAIGWALRGEVGVGSLVVGLGIGPSLHFWLHVLRALPERETQTNTSMAVEAAT